MKNLTLYNKYRNRLLAEGGFMDFMGDQKKTDAASDIALMAGQTLGSDPSIGKGALTGLGAGAKLGNSIMPGIGTAIGAGAGLLVGGLTGGLKAAKMREDEENANNAMKARTSLLGIRRSDALLTGNPTLATGNLNGNYFAYGGEIGDPKPKTLAKYYTAKYSPDSNSMTQTYTLNTTPNMVQGVNGMVRQYNAVMGDGRRTVVPQEMADQILKDFDPKTKDQFTYGKNVHPNDAGTLTAFADGGDLQQDPPVKGPIGYLNSYVGSPMFKKRLNGTAEEYADSQKLLTEESKNYKPVILNKDMQNIGNQTSGREINARYNLPPDTSMILSKKEAKNIHADLMSDILPHEYSHSIRDLSEKDEFKIASLNKSFNSKAAMADYKTDMENNQKQEQPISNYSNYLKDQDSGYHDNAPDENYSDLNSLRYMMKKQGIYDTRQRDMTPEDLKKAQADPWLKKQFGFKRLQDKFKDADIIKLNNTVASNDAAPTKVAANGGEIGTNKAPLSALDMKGGTAKSLSTDNTELVGNSHAEGGIDIPEMGAEVEGNETTHDNYVFSDKLGFAALHKPIARAKGKIEEKPATKERINSLRLLMGREQALKQQQEMVKAQLNLK